MKIKKSLRKMPASNFIIRTLSSAVIAAVVIAAVWLSPFTLLLLCGFITAAGMAEFFALSKNRDNVAVLHAIVVGLCTVVLSFLSSCEIIDSRWMFAAIPIVFTLFIAEMFRRRENPLENIAVAVMGIVYVAVPMSLLAGLGFFPDGDAVVYRRLYVLAFIILVWANDVGAYLTGVTFGRHKLFERLSPKKSWEGFFGGVIFTVAAGFLIAHFLDGDKGLWVVIGAVVSLAAVGGDLVESMFKREAGVKDSGKLIPGHGGILDRFDAMLMSVPFAYILVKLFG